MGLVENRRGQRRAPSLNAIRSTDHRLVELARDAQSSQPLAPEICLAPSPLGADALAPLLSGIHNHAVIFAQPALITHELYPLVVDAFTADSTAVGQAHYNVIGVHIDWIDDRHRMRRALFFDLHAQRFVEASLAVPQPIESAHFLSLGRDEQTLHAHWSAHLPVFQINPWAQAQRADDKHFTIKAWTQSGIDVPTTRPITTADASTVRTWLDHYGALVVKPNGASEGRGVAYLHTPEDWLSYVKEQSEQSDLLLQVRRDRVFFRDREQGSLHTLAVRIHVARCGASRRADSHYVQLGAHAHAPASRARGGRIVSAADLDDRLVYSQEGKWQPVELVPSFWDETLACAERAAAVFPDLSLVGLDFVVDMKGHRPTAIPIEANPRPAGLCHARRTIDGRSGVSEGSGTTCARTGAPRPISRCDRKRRYAMDDYLKRLAEAQDIDEVTALIDPWSKRRAAAALLETSGACLYVTSCSTKRFCATCRPTQPLTTCL